MNHEDRMAFSKMNSMLEQAKQHASQMQQIAVGTIGMCQLVGQSHHIATSLAAPAPVAAGVDVEFDKNLSTITVGAKVQVSGTGIDLATVIAIAVLGVVGALPQQIADAVQKANKPPEDPRGLRLSEN